MFVKVSQLFYFFQKKINDLQNALRGKALFYVACFFNITLPLIVKSQPENSPDSLFFYQQDFTAFQQRAAFENKPYIVFFTAPWCAPCHRLMNEVFTLTKISPLLQNRYLLYRINLDDLNDAQLNKALFKVEQLPTMLFFDPRGKPIDKATGYFDGYYLFKKLRLHIPPSQRGKDWGQEE